MKREYIIGLDLGINNVGWSVIDIKENKIIKKGVRLYKEADKAEDRRISRNTRRRIKRKKNRITEVLQLFTSIGFPTSQTIETELLEKRVKGLEEQLTKQEIVNIVCYFMSHRGYIPYGDEGRELIDLKDTLPCIYYKKLKDEIGKYRALEQVVNHDDLVKELIQILTTQSTFYPELKKIINNEKSSIISIFSRKRKFWEGPGSPTSFTPYGRFKNEEDVINYKKAKEKNEKYEKFLYEDLIGNCKIYKQEKCAPKSNYYAEEFNLLNDFINIRIDFPENIKNQEYLTNVKTPTTSYYKLSTFALEEIIKYCQEFKGKTLTYTKVLKEVLGLKKEEISGYRILRNGSPNFSLLNTYRFVKRTFQENNINSDWLWEDDYSNYNKLMSILAVAPGKVEIKNMLTSIHEATEEEIEIIKEIHDKLKKDQMLQYHALSEKALKKSIQDMKSTGMNFMQVSQKFHYGEEQKKELIQNYGTGEGKLLMNPKYVDELIASPQVKKTLRQSIKIINAIIKEQGQYPSVIAIESTKEVNGADKRREIEKEQKQNEQFRKSAKTILEENVQNEKVTENMIERVMLFEELNGQCPYCGRPIDLNKVLNNTLEVEHILPLSQSADDSFNNKTLSCRDCNSKKKNKTPYRFMTTVEFEEFTKRILSLKISEDKLKNFLTQEDINKHNIRFFNRNLRDTAYATKELVTQVHLFNDYLQEYTTNEKILTLSTPGQLTAKIRKDWNLNKDRDDGKYHHAVDASIVAGIATTKIGKKIIKSQNDPQYWIFHKEEKDEIPILLIHFDMPELKEDITQIKSDDDIKLSMQINKDPNRSLANANITSFIQKGTDYYKIEQIDNIYDADLMKNAKEKMNILFDENNPKLTLLCQEQNPKLFSYLKDIYNNYQDGKQNPFINYCIESKNIQEKKFDFLKYGIKTPSKNGKGVVVKTLRYMQNATDPFLLKKKNIKKKENTLVGLDSVSIYCTRLYWDKELHKILFLPVYCPAVNFKTKQINTEHNVYQNYFKKVIAGKNVQHIVDLYNGNYIEIKKPNGEILKEYVKGYSKSNKSIQCKSGKYLSPKDKFTLYDVDILGNKKKRLTWPEN